VVKVSKAALDKLAKEEDVQDLIRLYVDLVYSSEANEEDLPLSKPPLVENPFGKGIDGADPGVEVETGMSPDELARELGFPDHLPFLFNKYRHTKGFSAWDNPTLFENTNDPCVQPLCLHYHQLAGLHAIIRRVFTEQPQPGACTDVLLADEVGLGKTAVAISLMSFLSHIVMLQTTEMDMQIIPAICKYQIISCSPLSFLYRQTPLLGRQECLA